MDLHGIESLRSLNPHAHSPQDQHSLHDQQHSISHPGLYHVPLPSHLQNPFAAHHNYHPHHPQQQQHMHDSYNGYSPYDVDPLEQHVSLSHGLGPHTHPSSTCVPGLIPPGMDPGQVDMRTFYPYQPNEVKHRKRTTRGQLKVLEDVYKYDTKPNATLRKKLAEELGMTPRGVQVWFQNRRAKTKSQARKADAANKKGEEGSVSGTNAPEAAENGGSQPPSPVAASSPLPGADNSGLTGTATPRTPSLSSEEGAPSTNAQAAEINSPDSGSGTSSSPRTITEVSPTAKPQPIPSPNSNAARGDSEPSDLSVGINTSLFGNPFPFGPPPAESSAGSSPSIPPTPADQRGMGLGSGLMAIPEHLRNQRRPSLPIIVSPPVGGNQSFLGQDLSPHQQRVSPLSFMQQGEHMRSDTGTGNTLLDPSIRRRSVDINMTRLGVHPYAHLATNAGGAQAGDLNLLRRGSMPHVLDPQMMTNGLVNRSNGMLGPQTHAHPVRRPGMYSRMSMPQLMHMQEETTNFDESPPRISQPFNGNPNLPANLVHFGARFSVPSREISAPIPGPLPSPGFSFGDAPTSTDSNGSPNLAAPSTSSHPRFLLNTRRSLSGPAEDADTEDDASAISSNYPFSRFGSFASVAGSESSFTSGGGWSESGSGKAHSQHRGSDGQLHAENMNNGFERRPSASGQMLELFHDLGVSGNGNHTPQPHSQPLSRSRSGDGSEGNGHDPTTSGGVGGGSNNNADMQGADGSELAYALRQDKDAASTDVLQYPGGYSPGSDQRLGHRLSDDVNGQYGYPNHDEHQHQQTMPKQEFPGSYSESGYAYGPSSNHNALHFEFMGGAGAGGSGPYHNGAIELSNMCVPASMDYHVVAPYMQYS